MNDSDSAKKGLKRWLGPALLAAAAVLVFVLALLAASIMERRQESAMAMTVLQPIDAFETDAAEWAVNYPRQYDRYLKMKQTDAKTKYGGSALRDYLAETPANVILFAGYAFSKEYNQARGHTYAKEDVSGTARISAASPATCWTCKSPDVPRKMAELGKAHVDDSATADFQKLIMAGAGDFYAATFAERAADIHYSIACLDCHDPKTMQLRISRPALLEGLTAAGVNLEEVTHQDMRTLVCAQCHVEYYFKKETNYLTFPWSQGLSVEEMEQHYQTIGFTDWVHGISGTPMVKMQHPDYELYTHGIHAYRNVACADCHMPYRTEGGMKFTDHHVQSPLLNIENSCMVCHRWSEEEIRGRVESIQDSVRQGRDRAEQALVRAHFDVAACVQAGAADEELKEVRGLVRAAQLRWDYVAANNGMGFHAPQETGRILTAAVELAQEARVLAAGILARHGHTGKVHYPDTSSKEKAQALLARFKDGNAPDLLGAGEL